MPPERVAELLYDTEAALRLVMAELLELHAEAEPTLVPVPVRADRPTVVGRRFRDTRKSA
jgi:hypothetical protein